MFYKLLAFFSLIWSPCIPLEQQIIRALRRGYCGFARALIEQNPDLLSNPFYGQSPLTHAVLNGQSEFVAWCVARDVLNTNDHRIGGMTPLSGALFLGNLEVVRIILDAGAQVSTQFIDGHYPLHYAALYCPAAITLLLKKGAQPDSLNYHENTPLAVLLSHDSKYDAQSKNALEALLLAGANPYAIVCSTNRWVRLHLVDDLGIIPGVEALIELLDLGCSLWGGISRETLRGIAVKKLLESKKPHEVAVAVAARAGNGSFAEECKQSVSPELFALNYLKQFSKPEKLPAFQMQ